MIGRAANVSPKRVEHLIRGYFGTLGMYALGTADMVTRRMFDFPEPPAEKLHEYGVLRRFYRGSGESPETHTKYGTRMYEMINEADQLYSTILHLRRTGDYVRAREMLREEKEILSKRKALNRASSQIREINRRIKAIHLKKGLTGEEKRAKIDKLIERKNMIAERAYEQAEAAFG